MARFHRIKLFGATGEWYLVSPSSLLEAARFAWMLWRHPDQTALLVSLRGDYANRWVGPGVTSHPTRD